MILVTGGTGFLGTTLIRHLLASGIPIRATKRPSSTVTADLSNQPLLEWVDADLNNFFELEDAFQDIDQVYHCAAMVSFQPADRKKMLKVNVEGTTHIVNLCITHRARLLHVSSVAALGDPKPGFSETTEDDIWEFDGTQHSYAISKYESEMEVWRGMVEGLDAVIINPSLIIGQQAGENGSGAIFKLLKKGLRYYTTGSAGLVDVEDVAHIAILLMNDRTIKGERFIVSHVNLAYKELFEICAGYLGRPAPSRKATPKMMEIAWRAVKIASWFTGKTPSLTRDTARASFKKQAFSTKKLESKLSYTFKPLNQTLKEICEHL